MKKMLLIILIVGLITQPVLSYADVGDFESYDPSFESDYDSDYDYDYDYDSEYDYDYDYDSDYDYDWDSESNQNSKDNTSNNSSSVSINPAALIMSTIGIIVVITIIIILINKNEKKRRENDFFYNFFGEGKYKNRNDISKKSSNREKKTIKKDANRTGYKRDLIRNNRVKEEVCLVDKSFNEEKFLTWVRNLFVKLQTSWSERNWEEIRSFEADSLFEQHLSQLEGYVMRKQINKIEKILINFAELVSFEQDNEKEILVVALNASMLDYIVDEKTGKIIKGNNERKITNTYKLTFLRKKGVLTEDGGESIKIINCPNCGAPAKVSAIGKCEFCASVITTETHDWILCDLERY